jgi:thioredoxin 1
MLRKIISLIAVLITLALAQKTDNTLDLNDRAREIDALIDSATVLTDGGEIEASRGLLRIANERWVKYAGFHKYVAEREFAPQAQLDTLVAAISGRFEQILEGDVRAGLPELKERLKLLFIAADLPILADFSGSTCKFCKIMKARLTQVAPEYRGQVRIVYVNVNEERELVKLFRVSLIPTLVFIGRDGQENSRFVGAMEEKDLKKRLDSMAAR